MPKLSYRPIRTACNKTISPVLAWFEMPTLEKQDIAIENITCKFASNILTVIWGLEIRTPWDLEALKKCLKKQYPNLADIWIAQRLVSNQVLKTLKSAKLYAEDWRTSGYWQI